MGNCAGAGTIVLARAPVLSFLLVSRETASGDPGPADAQLRGVGTIVLAGAPVPSFSLVAELLSIEVMTAGEATVASTTTHLVEAWVPSIALARSPALVSAPVQYHALRQRLQVQRENERRGHGAWPGARLAQARRVPAGDANSRPLHSGLCPSFVSAPTTKRGPEYSNLTLVIARFRAADMACR